MSNPPFDPQSWLREHAQQQRENIARHVLPDGQSAWLRRAGARNPAWRYGVMALVARGLGLDVLRPVPNLGGEAAIATEARRLRDLAARGVLVPQLLAAQTDALLISDVGGENLLVRISAQAREGSLQHWQLGLEAIAQAHARGAYLSQAFARNMVIHENGDIAFIDFEDDPGDYLPVIACQCRDWLCYLQSSAWPIAENQLIPAAKIIWQAHFANHLSPEMQNLLLNNTRILQKIPHLKNRRWGRDTLRLVALAQLLYS